MGSFTPDARAAAITARLEQLEKNPFLPTPEIRISEDGTNALATAGDILLFSVTEEDARLASTDRLGLAKARAALVQASLERHRLGNRLRAVGAILMWTLLVLSLAVGSAWLLSRAFTRLGGWVSRSVLPKIGAIRIQRLELLSSTQSRRALVRAIGFLKFLAYLGFAYVYLSILFSLLPATRGLASKLFELALTPVLALSKAALAYLPNLFFLAVIAVATRLLLRLLRLVFDGIQNGKLVLGTFHPEWADPTLKLSRILVFAFALVLAFPYLPGSGSEAFKGVSLFLGVLFSLGSSGAMTNLVAGVLLTYMRPFKVGDRVRIGDTEGDVLERSALVTRILTIKNEEVSIPNSTVLAGQVLNFSAQAMERGLILHSTVTIGYDAPWRTVHDLLLAAARATEGILADPAPFVLQTSLDDFYVSYQVNAYTDQPNRMATIYGDLHANIQDRFNEGGVEIMSPHYRAARDGNATTIPEEHRAEGYMAPAFRVHSVSPGQS
ncbi:MAG: mechanosensitive ion channel [Holophagaceae bacterium]|nr:mechanosensitive ion channel [Holophagaceae bacterium]